MSRTEKVMYIIVNTVEARWSKAGLKKLFLSLIKILVLSLTTTEQQSKTCYGFTIVLRHFGIRKNLFFVCFGFNDELDSTKSD